MLRTIDEDLKDVVIEASGSRRSHAASIEDFRGDLRDFLPSDFPEITKFTISQMHPMGMQKTTSGKASFITSVVEAVDRFYVDILQKQRVWTTPAPEYKRPAQLDDPEEETFTTAEIVAGDD